MMVHDMKNHDRKDRHVLESMDYIAVIIILLSACTVGLLGGMLLIRLIFG